MGLRGVTLTLDSDRFSDLFFNYEHPRYDALMDEGNTVHAPADIRRALTHDALDFIFICNLDKDDAGLVEELVDDFLKRL